MSFFFQPAHAEAAKRYLAQIDAKTRHRGQAYWKQKRVSQLQLDLEEGSLTAVVKGSHSYKVTFNWDEAWFGFCTCPVGDDCKHAAATLYAALARPSEATVPEQSQKTAPKPNPLKGFAALLHGRLGRKLSKEEQNAADCVDRLFSQFRDSRRISEQIFLPLRSDRSRAYWSYENHPVWPAPPASLWEAWLYIAALFRRLEWPLIPGLKQIIVWEEVDALIHNWERHKKVEEWHSRVESATKRLEQGLEASTELRIRLTVKGAQLEWRKPGWPQFKEIKGSGFNSFLYTEHLPFDPLSLSLWKLFASYASGPFRDYESGGTPQLLQMLLHLPGYQSRLVNPNGLAFHRSEQSLRWRIDSANLEKADYQLALVLEDGSSPPAALAIIDGNPSFYITSEAIYPAPQFAGLPMANGPVEIPAEVVETNHGLRLLDQLDLPTPKRIAERMQTVQIHLVITCWLATEDGNETLQLKMHAESAPEVVHAEFGIDGWRHQRPEQDASETLTRWDDTALKHAVPLIEIFQVTWNPYTRRWSRRVPKHFPEQFAAALAQLPAESNIILKLDPLLASLRDHPISARVSLEVKETDIDWFDLRVELSVSDTTLTQEEIQLLLAAKGGFVRLGAKGWRRLNYTMNPEEEQQLADIGLGARDFSPEPQRLHALQLAGKRATLKLLPEAQTASIEKRAQEIRTRVTPDVPAGLKATLRPYQIEGYHFLAYLTENHFGGILADDMGLGKTVQTLAWLLWLRGRPDFNGYPSLVVCPKSVTENWAIETARFAPELRASILPRGDCDAAQLERLRAENDLLIINYAQLRLIASLSEKPWLAVILDEAQYIKNPQSQTAQSANKLKAAHRLALSGTPIENRLMDLWSILHFAMPGILGNRAAFTRNFDQKNDPLARRRLAARVRPFLIRRTKKEVAKELPDRIEEDILCTLEGDQSKLYSAELKRARAALLKIKTNKQLDKARFNILTSLLRLRQICCHPALVQAKSAKSESAKLNALVDLLEPLVEEGQKVLIFSQFVEMLRLIREELFQRGWKHLILTGETENRGDLVRDFQETEGANVFLISLRAGGFGLNLTAASYVILFDPWWNPAVENQAIDRTHRIGQTQTVNAYRLITKNSIEEKIRSLQTSKSALAEDILGEESFTRSLTLADFKFLLEQ